MNVLFVCTGNTCRSPMCEGYLRSLCEKSGRTDIHATSAGLFAYPGGTASPQACEVMKKYNADISGHAVRPVDAQSVSQADLILAMTGSHRKNLCSAFPDAAGKVHLLLEYADAPGADVPDPFGGSFQTYESCFKKMKKAIDNLFLTLNTKIK